MTLLLGGRITNKNVATTNLFSLLEQKTSAPNRTQNFIAGAGGNNNGNSAQQPGANNVSRNELLAYEPNFTFYDFNVKWAVGAPKKRRTNVTETYTEAANWLNKGWSIQASEKWTDRFQSNINISQSGHQDEKLSTSTLNSFDTKRPLPSGKIVIAPNSEKTTINTNNNFNKIDGFDINFKNEWQIDEQQALTFGLNYINNKVVVDLVVDDESILDKKLNTNQQAAYAQYNFNSLDKKWKIGLGLRSTYYSTTNKNYWSPRINLNYKVNKPLQIKAAWSRYNQFLRRNYYEERFGRTHEFWVMANDARFPVAASTNWMAGFNFFHEFIEIDVELYHKKTTGILEYALSDIGLNATYTLSKTTHSFEKIKKGTLFPGRDDRRHQFKWVNQYKFKQFDFSATYVFASGRPYTDLSNFTGVPQNRQNLEPTARISYLASYQRVDIGANYNFKWGKTNGLIGLSIFNLLNRKNVKYRQYVLSVRDPENTGSGQSRPRNTVLGTELQMLDFTPNLSFSLHF